MPEFTIDEVGQWTEIKLAIIQKYSAAFTSILSKQGGFGPRHFAYIDAFAGAGTHISRDTGEEIDGSPFRALKTVPPFSFYHFVELNPARADRLRAVVATRSDAMVYEGDTNSVLLKQVFPQCRYEDYRRALCLLDPYDLNPAWEVVQTAGSMRSIEVFLNFMIMDANMNVFWRASSNPDPAQVARMDVFWGDESWRDVAWELVPDLFEDQREKASNETIARAYAERLRKVAGFPFVLEPMAMRNSRGATIYYLLFASHNATGAKIAAEVMDPYRTGGSRGR